MIDTQGIARLAMECLFSTIALSSIQVGTVRTVEAVVSGYFEPFWSYGKNLQTKFTKIFQLYQDKSSSIKFFIYCLQEKLANLRPKLLPKQSLHMSQTVSIPTNQILLTYIKSTFITSHSTLSVKVGSISFLSSSEMDQSNHLSGCHAIGISSLLKSFLYALRCVYSSYNASFKKKLWIKFIIMFNNTCH